MNKRQPYILFRLDRATYAVPASQVAYVDMVEAITPVPHAPPYVAGVVYSRGRVLPVIDLRLRFGMPAKAPDLQSRLIVTQWEDRTVGLLVDEAREFANLDPERIMLPPESVLTPGSDFLAGVTLLNEQRLVFVLDLERILTPEEADTLPEVSDQPAPKE